MSEQPNDNLETPDDGPSGREEAAAAVTSIAKGAAAGGLAGGIAAAGKSAVKSKRLRRFVAAGLVMTLLPLFMLFSVFMSPSGITGTSGNQQVASVEQAVTAGLSEEEITILSNPVYNAGLPWHVVAALFLTQRSGTGGVGPYQITEDALDDEFTEEDAADPKKATRWVSEQLRDLLGEQDRWMASTDIGIGGKLEAGQLFWFDEDASETLVRAPFRSALSAMSLAGASTSWADTIVDTAIHWRFGLAAGPVPCTITYSGTLPDNLSFEITPEQMGNAVIIVQTGQSLGIPEQGLVIALMTALQESTLRNLTYGDRDSLGLFQQRPSTGWGSPDEILDPVKSSKGFYGMADHTSNPGLVDITNWQSMPLGEAAQAVQRSAFPDAYAKWEPDAALLVAQITGKVPPPSGRTVLAMSGGKSAPIVAFAPRAGYDIGPVQAPTQYMADDLGTKFSIETIYGWREFDPYPDHPSGLAADFMVFEDRANGDALAKYAQENASVYGIKYMIWYQRYWQAGWPVGQWRPMEDRGGVTANHMDHVHITVNPEGGTGTPTDVGSTSCGIGKPFLSGLLARTDLSQGKGGDRTDELQGFVLQLDWDQIEKEQGVYDTSRIDAAIAYASSHNMRFRLRIRPGIHAPQWAKELSAHGRPLPRFFDHDENKHSDLPYLYDPDYMSAWQAMMTALGAKYDSYTQVGEVNVSAFSPMTAEWMLLFSSERADNGKTNLQNMQDAGFTEEDRGAAVRADAAGMLAAWPTTPITVWAHPYFSLDGGVSTSATFDWIDEISALSPRFSFGHTGLDEHTIDKKTGAFAIYEHITTNNHPITLQTRSIDGGHGQNGLGSLENILEWAVEYGVMAIELPNGWQSQNPSAEAISSAATGMAANAAQWSTGGPGATINGDAALPLPAGSYFISSPFGPRPSPTPGGSTDHKGVDMAPNDGGTPPIFAAAAGTVSFAGDCGCGYGLLVSIKVGDSMEMYYGHQSRVMVTTGQTVTVGQQIGVVGNTGASSGNHLHFEIRVNDVPQDPVPIMAAAGITL